MANVLFKKGLSTALPTTGDEGTFYLTTDTRRLYVGTSDKKIVPICETVQVVANVAALSSLSDVIEGQFYYAAAENILCIRKDSKWVQINPDTRNSSIDIQFEAGTDGKSGSLTIEVTDTSKDASEGDNVVADTVSISLTNLQMKANADNDTVELIGDKNTLNTVVNADADTAKVTLQSSLGLGDTSVTLKGEGGIAIKGTNGADGEIIISAEDVILPSENNLAFDANGVLHTEIVMDNEDVITGTTVTPTISVAGTGYKFENGTATLPVYSKEEINQKFKDELRTLNAMTYKGTLTASTSKPNAPTTAQIGDAWLVVGTGQITVKAGPPAVYAEPGDLLIARGTEGADGNITSATLVWDVVPSGDEIDTTYRLAAGEAANTVELLGKASGGDEEVAGTLGIFGGTQVDVERDGTNFTVNHGATPGKVANTTSNYNGRITETHKSVKTTEFTVIDSITQDSFGHIKTLNTKTVKLEDTNLNGIGNEISVAAGTNSATVTVTAVGIDANGNIIDTHADADQNFIVQSSNANLTVGVDAATDAVVLNYVWGSF